MFKAPTPPGKKSPGAGNGRALPAAAKIAARATAFDEILKLAGTTGVSDDLVIAYMLKTAAQHKVAFLPLAAGARMLATPFMAAARAVPSMLRGGASALGQSVAAGAGMSTRGMGSFLGNSLSYGRAALRAPGTMLNNAAWLGREALGGAKDVALYPLRNAVSMGREVIGGAAQLGGRALGAGGNALSRMSGSLGAARTRVGNMMSSAGGGISNLYNRAATSYAQGGGAYGMGERALNRGWQALSSGAQGAWNRIASPAGWQAAKNIGYYGTMPLWKPFQWAGQGIQAGYQGINGLRRASRLNYLKGIRAERDAARVAGGAAESVSHGGPLSTEVLTDTPKPGAWDRFADWYGQQWRTRPAATALGTYGGIRGFDYLTGTGGSPQVVVNQGGY